MRSVLLDLRRTGVGEGGRGRTGHFSSQEIVHVSSNKTLFRYCCCSVCCWGRQQESQPGGDCPGEAAQEEARTRTPRPACPAQDEHIALPPADGYACFWGPRRLSAMCPLVKEGPKQDSPELGQASVAAAMLRMPLGLLSRLKLRLANAHVASAQRKPHFPVSSAALPLPGGPPRRESSTSPCPPHPHPVWRGHQACTGGRMGAATAAPPLADPAPGQEAATNW